MSQENVEIIKRSFVIWGEPGSRPGTSCTTTSTLRDGKIARTDYFNDRRQALDAAGMAE